MEKQSTRKFLKLIVALVALFLLGASALMLASCNKDEHQHSYTSSVTTPATCSNPGVETFTCSCGLTYTTVIPATGEHTWETVQEYPASCESDGYSIEECSQCHTQRTIVDEGSMLTHKYEAVETVEATCTEDGYQLMQCSYCGDRYYNAQYSAEHKATGHKWIVNESPADPADLTDAEGWKVVKAADCLNAAQLQRKCSVCGETEEKAGAAATGHFVDGKKYTTNLCKVDPNLVDAEGNKVYAFECENENCPVSVVVDARGTKKHYVKAVDHKMKTIAEHINCVDTATDKSYIEEICENCDTWSEEDPKETEVKAAGHNFNTVQTDGKTSVVVCIEDKGLNTQAKYLEYMRSVVDFATFQANRETYVDIWEKAKTDNGVTGDTLAISRVCARCGAITVANGHDYVIAKYVEGSFTEYEKDEDGALVDYSKEVTVASMNCRYVRICSGCGDITNRGAHKNVSTATCRAAGVCADCGRAVEAQKSHIYVNISALLNADGTFNDKATVTLPTGVKAQEVYDAWKKVSATETWLVPVAGDCDSESTTVYVCAQCLVDAAKGTEVTWNKATEMPTGVNVGDNITAAAVATNAYVITREFSHDYQPVYFDLDAKDTTEKDIPYYNTDCQIGFKVAYICSKCGEVFTNVPVANDPDTKPADKNVEEDSDDTNEAKDNKLPDAGLPQVYTDANGFVIDSTKVDDGVEFQAEELAIALAAVLNNKGEHLLYVVAGYDKTSGYVAPTCVAVGQVPYTCLHCGKIVVLSAGADDSNNPNDVNDVKNTFEYADKTTNAKELEAALGKDYATLVLDQSALKTDEAIDPTNHAGEKYACGTHCKVKDVSGKYICAGFDSNKDGTIADTELEAIGTSDSAHATANVEYSLISTVKKYYSDYTLKIANVGTVAKSDDAALKNDINNYITSFEDTTKVSVCSGNKYEAPKYGVDFVGGTSDGKFLVLVDANGKAYYFDTVAASTTGTNALKFYYESNASSANEITNLKGVTVKDDDIFFVGFEMTSTSTLPVKAPITASDSVSLGLALNNNAPVPVTENGKQITVLTVTLADDFDVDAIPQTTQNVNRVVYDLNGHELETTGTAQFAPKGKDIVFKNGELTFTSTDQNITTATSRINPTGSGKFTLDGVTMTTAAGTAIFAEYANEAVVGETGKYQLAIPEIVINNSTIVAAGGYAVSTNASLKDAENADSSVTADTTVTSSFPEVKITITDSTLTAGVSYNVLTGKYAPNSSGVQGTALFINVPSDVTVDGSALVANRQVVMVRGGELEMSDSTIELVKDDNIANDLNVVWSDGNSAPHAAMMLGNDYNDDAYQYKTTVILDNVTFNVDASDYTVVIASDYSNATLAAQDDTKYPANTADADKTFDNITTMPIMVYLDAGSCVNDKQIDFVKPYDAGTIKLVGCGNASGIY